MIQRLQIIISEITEDNFIFTKVEQQFAKSRHHAKH
jgi:hypothetical protein